MKVLANAKVVNTLQYTSVSSQHIILYTLNLYNVTCQFYLNKAGK